MGEIADALNKAREELETERASAPAQRVPAPRPTPPPAPAAPEAASPDAGTLSRFDRVEPVEAPAAPAAEAAEEVTGPHSDPNAERNRAHFERLALRVRTELERLGKHCFALVSALRDEGKSTISLNIAHALASLSPGRRVALIDFDLRNPSIGRRLNVESRYGIDSVLAGECRLEDACCPIDPSGLDLYPALHPHRSAHELLAGPLFGAVMDELESRYATVVLDTSPALLVPDASLVLRRGAACAAVVRVGVSRVRRLTELVALLPAEQFIGTIVNCAPVPRHQRSYSEYYYGSEHQAEAAP